MEIHQSDRSKELYQRIQPKLSNKQVLVPKIKNEGPDPSLGLIIVGWRLLRMRLLSVQDIDAIMQYVPEQLDEAKRAKLELRRGHLTDGRSDKKS